MNLFSGFWLNVYNFLVLGTLLGAVIFTVGHSITTQWWKSVQGKNVFFFGLVISLAFTFLSLRIVFGNFPARPAISLILVAALFVAVWWRTILWLRGQISRKKNGKEEH